MVAGIVRIFALVVELTSACVNDTEELPEKKDWSIDMKPQCYGVIKV